MNEFLFQSPSPIEQNMFEKAGSCKITLGLDDSTPHSTLPEKAAYVKMQVSISRFNSNGILVRLLSISDPEQKTNKQKSTSAMIMTAALIIPKCKSDSNWILTSCQSHTITSG